MTINSTLDCLILYKRICNQTDSDKAILENDGLIKLMLSDQRFVVDLIDVYLKYTVHPDQYRPTKLNQIKFFVYSKLLAGNYFNKPGMYLGHYEAILKYGEVNSDLIGVLLATPSMWIGNSDDYDYVIQALNGYAEDYYLKCLESNTIGSAIYGFAKFKQFERHPQEYEGREVINPHRLYDYFILYKKSMYPEYVYEPLKEEFFRMLFGISAEDKVELVPYFNDLIEGIKTGKMSYQMGLKLSNCSNKGDFIKQIKGPVKKHSALE